MKSLTQPSRLAAAACAALVLAACGGGNDGDLFLAGEIRGLTKSGLVLENRANGDTLPILAGAAAFAFTKRLSNDEAFDVQVKTQPTGAVCTPSQNKGRTGAYSINTILIECVTNAYQLGGKITGLTGSGLELINGNDKLVVAAGAASFVMPAKVPDGSPYGIVIFKQPANQNCTVTGGTPTGLMGSADQLNAVQITCN
ncbi:MAG TPA: hypothetical protein VFT37_00800 [Telluria sp.]|nr:hypothetical protein [Telluria sp.]